MRWYGLLPLILLCGPVWAADWPCWGGSTQNFCTPEASGYGKTAWRLTPRWQAQTGTGEAAPIVADVCVYTIGFDKPKKQDVVACRDAATGAIAWEQRYAAPARARYARGDYNFYAEGPCAPPTYDAATGYLFTMGCDGDVHCWDTRARGKRVWAINLYDAFNVPPRKGDRDYGFTTAPLVAGDVLIVEVGAPAGSLMAFDTRTGKRRWVSKEVDQPGHTLGPRRMTLCGLPCVAVLGLTKFMAVRLDHGHVGETLASYAYYSQANAHVAVPVQCGDLISLSTHLGSDDLLRIGRTKIDFVGASPHAEVYAPTMLGDCAYGASNATLTCWRFTPKGITRVWTTNERFKSEGAVIITGDKKLLVFGYHRIALFTLDGKKLAEVANLPTGWPIPALANHQLYLRNGTGTLVCYTVGG